MASSLERSCRSPSRLVYSSWGGPRLTSHTNVVVVAEVEEFLPRELGAIVDDDRVGYAEADLLEDEGQIMPNLILERPIAYSGSSGSVKKDTASSERTLTMGRASIHLENLSTATRR
jgi:hypothetical protein